MGGDLDTGFDESTEVRKICGVAMIGRSIDIERAVEALTDAARCVGASFGDLRDSLISLVETFNAPRRSLPDLTLLPRRINMDGTRSLRTIRERPLGRIRLSQAHPRVRLLPSPPRIRLLMSDSRSGMKGRTIRRRMGR